MYPWPTAKAQGFVVGSTLFPDNGQLPWLSLGTQPGRADPASLGYTSTLGLLGTAVVVCKTASPKKLSHCVCSLPVSTLGVEKLALIFKWECHKEELRVTTLKIILISGIRKQFSTLMGG